MTTPAPPRDPKVWPWVVGVLVVFGILFAAGRWWWHSHGEAALGSFKQGATVAIEQGKQFGPTAGYRGCLEHSTALAAECGSMNLLCEVNASLFLKGCLDTAPDTATFCASQPPEGEIIARAVASVQVCAALNRPTDRCGRVVREGQKACDAPVAQMK